MLARKNRLTNKEDFRDVHRSGRLIKGDFLCVKIKKTNTPGVRVGFVVGKKVSVKAEVRNEVKRRMRSAMSECLARIKKSSDIIVIAFPEIRNKTFGQIRSELEQVLKKWDFL